MKIRQFYLKKNFKFNITSRAGITPGLRHSIKFDKNILCRAHFLVKNLRSKIPNAKGRSSHTGHITVRHRGSGCKRLYCNLNFKNTQSVGFTVFLTYDPIRCARVALVYNFFKNNFFFALAGTSCVAGSIFACNAYIKKQIGFHVGLRVSLKSLIYGMHFYGLSDANGVSVYARAAGSFCQLFHKHFEICSIRLPSGITKTISCFCYGTVGRVSNEQQRFTRLGMAGKKRLLGRRPHVRGIAMNPVDHPHGGRTTGGFHPKTPWGIPTRGFKTNRKKI